MPVLIFPPKSTLGFNNDVGNRLDTPQFKGEG